MPGELHQAFIFYLPSLRIRKVEVRCDSSRLDFCQGSSDGTLQLDNNL